MKVELFTSDHNLNGNIPESNIATLATNSTTTRSHAISTDSAINRTLFESEMHTFSDDSSSDMKRQGEQQSLKKQRDLQTDQVNPAPAPLGQVSRDFDHKSSASTVFDDGLSDIAPLSLSFSDRLSMARSKHTQEKKKMDQLGTVSQKKRSWDSDRDFIPNNGDGMNQNGADKDNSDSVAQRRQKRRKNSISKDPLVENESF